MAPIRANIVVPPDCATDFSLGPAMGGIFVELLSRKDDGAASDALEIDNPVAAPPYLLLI
jgi:hypothetical protein